MDLNNQGRPERLLRVKDLEKTLGLSKSTIYERIRNGGFPKPIKLGNSATSASAFYETEVREWIAQRQRKF